MKYPTLRGNTRYRLRVPALSGGVNWRDEGGLAGDDQLTECSNVWWENGGLRTRPGLSVTQQSYFCRTDELERESILFPRLQQGHDSFMVRRYAYRDGDACDYYSYRISADGRETKELGLTMRLYGMGSETSMLLVIPPQSEQDSTELYAFGSSVHGATLCRKEKNADTWSEAKPYIPTVLINGGDRGQGTAYEGYNLLTGAFRCLFTTDGTVQRFYLPRKPLSRNLGQDVSITYTDAGGEEYFFSVPSPDQQTYAYSDGVTVDGQTVYARVDYLLGRVTFWKSTTSTAATNAWTPPDVGHNNNLVILAYQTDGVREQKIGRMTFSTWFGGGTGSLKTGTRLFVSGHPDYPGLVHWSDIDNPLYFPENNYAYVGGTGEAVTAFGKQSDMLVIFKQNSIYAMTYTEGSYTADDLTAGAVVDVTAASALFPVRQLHPAIGCDCPATLALCQNRLVWVNTDGNVHMLLSSSGYSDSNVRELGRQVETRLKPLIAAAETVCAVAWRGRYVLLVDNTAFLLDYGDTAFARYGSYSDDRQAQSRLAWYVWDLTLPYMTWQYMTSDGESLCLFGRGIKEGEPAVNTFCYSPEGEYDDAPLTLMADSQHNASFVKQAVRSVFATKPFHFDRPERYKRIGQVWLELSGKKESELNLFYVTERGTVPDGNTVACGEMTASDMLSSHRFTPNVGRVCRFGLRGESVGPVCIGGLALTYQMEGGIR